MTREDFIEAGIDYDSAMNLFMGKQEIFERFLTKFKNDESYSKIKDAIADNDCEAAFKAAHTLKGVAGNLSFKDLAKAASDITEEFRAGNFEGGLQYIDELDAQYKRILDFISAM